MLICRPWVFVCTVLFLQVGVVAQEPKTSVEVNRLANFLVGDICWRVGEPLLDVESARLPESPEHPWVAVKDPSIVHHDGRWHLFCTLRKQKEGDGRIRIGHLTFEKFSQAAQANWSVLELTDDYHGAPQIFYFRPHEKWYLIYQATDPARNLKYGPCYSTNADISDPAGWTRPKPLYVAKPGSKVGLDYWVICDRERAHLFFTSLDGRMWRAETRLEDFPNRGWADPVVALKADIFEASHTYKIREADKYVTFVEAQAGKRRYFKLFVADSLDGQWRPAADSREHPFVSPVNVVNQAASWATSYSHGELLRSGSDELMEVSIENMRLLFQGADDRQYQSGSYGDIPWRLGILESVDCSKTP